MSDPVDAAFTILGGASKGLSALQTINAGKAERTNLRTRQTQERIAATERSIQRTEELSRILSANTARAAAGGMDLSSASFRSVQANDFNVFNEDEKLASLNLNFREDFLKGKMRSSRRQETASLVNLAGKSLLQAGKIKFGKI